MQLPQNIYSIAEDGTKLEGRIVEATRMYIGVELVYPLHKYLGINFGFISAIGKRFPLTPDGTEISETGCEAAARTLERAYRAAKKELLS